MIKVLIVENEVESSRALTSLLETHFTNIKLIGVCPDVASAVKRVRLLTPEIIFLDIELNGESGFDLLEKIESPTFEVIFTTAFSDYALRAIKHACLDYLMKPVGVEELKSAIDKFHQKEKLNSYKEQVKILLENIKRPVHEAKICIPVSGGYVFVNKSDIVMCKAEANYSMLHSVGGEKIICSKNLGALEDMLGDDTLFRCHKSYLINIDYVKKFWRKESPHVVLYNELEAEVSSRKKDELLTRMRKVGYSIEDEPKKQDTSELASLSKSYQNLTFREIEIVRCVALGMGAKEIGNKLFIAETTVKTHRKNLLAKTSAKNTSELVHYATLLGLI